MIAGNQNTDKKTKLGYMGPDGFIVYIKVEQIYEDITKDVETRFDTSIYELKRALPKRKKKLLN